MKSGFIPHNCRPVLLTFSIQEGRVAAALDIRYDPIFHNINRPEGFVHSAFQVLRMQPGSSLTLAPVCSTWVYMTLAFYWWSLELVANGFTHLCWPNLTIVVLLVPDPFRSYFTINHRCFPLTGNKESWKYILQCFLIILPTYGEQKLNLKGLDVLRNILPTYGPHNICAVPQPPAQESRINGKAIVPASGQWECPIRSGGKPHGQPLRIAPTFGFGQGYMVGDGAAEGEPARTSSAHGGGVPSS